MVSMRCKLVVKEELRKLGIEKVRIDLGIVEIFEPFSARQYEKLNKNLLLTGLELLDDKKSILIGKIKNVIIEMIHYSDDVPKINFSDYLSKKLDYNYTYLSNIFSEVNGITLQQFIINHKVERIKELLLYEELNLTEIAHKLHYSSAAHLSTQFKRSTGFSPSEFKQMRVKRLINLENL